MQMPSEQSQSQQPHILCTLCILGLSLPDNLKIEPSNHPPPQSIALKKKEYPSLPKTPYKKALNLPSRPALITSCISTAPFEYTHTHTSARISRTLAMIIAVIGDTRPRADEKTLSPSLLCRVQQQQLCISALARSLAGCSARARNCLGQLSCRHVAYFTLLYTPSARASARLHMHLISRKKMGGGGESEFVPTTRGRCRCWVRLESVRAC